MSKRLTIEEVEAKYPEFVKGQIWRGSREKYGFHCLKGHDDYEQGYHAHSSGCGCPVCGHEKKGEKIRKFPTKGEKWSHLTATGEYEVRNQRTWAEFKCDCGEVVWKILTSVKIRKIRCCEQLCKYNGFRKGVIADQNRVYGNYKHSCHYKNRDFIHFEQESWLIVVQQPCLYCRAEPAPYVIRSRKGLDYEIFLCNGVDHFDPKIKEPEGNSVPCCAACNHEKMDMSPEEWYNRLVRTRGKAKADEIWLRVEKYLEEQVKG